MARRFLRGKDWNLWSFVTILFTACSCLPDGDLCRWMNGRKYYIDVGESGIISAENVTSQTSAPIKGTSNDSSLPQIPQRCSVELITCPSCHFQVSAIQMNIPTCSSDSTCRCDFVWVKEAAYSKSGQEFCGDNTTVSSTMFESKTKLVSVDFLYTGSYEKAFALQFKAMKNVYIYKGGYNFYQSNSTGKISSPNFPGGYPSDYSAEYILQNADTTGFVQLLFVDFQLSLWSYMEILDSNGSRIDVYNGNTFRPPALISSGPTMTVKFQANDEYPSSGFLAIYTFVNYADKYWINRPSTDCGGFVEDYGGAITMMNMVPGSAMRAFDCIWLIRPRNAHVPGKHISVRVGQFEEMGPKSTLTIRQGLYSDTPILESVTPFQHQKLHRGQEYIVPANVGLYIRMVGFFNNKSHLAIVYSTFRYEGCYTISDFECENGRCIKSSLRCDGFNHCGDGSDEASCFGSNQGTPLPEDVNWWRTLTPNYYFPKADSNTGSGTNTLILVTSLAGLGMFVLTTIVILVKLHKQRQDDTISREILHTISGDMDSDSSPVHHHSDPPVYDPPPSYDDAVKFYIPPPPAYTTIGRNQGSNNCQTRSVGVGSADVRTENAAASRSQVRRTKQNISTLYETEPLVLQVCLPNDSSRPISAPAAKSSGATASSNLDKSINNGNTTELLKSTSGKTETRTDYNKKKRLSLSRMQQTSPKTKPSQSKSKSVEELPNTTPILSEKGKTNVSGRNSSLACECQGACSCLSSNKKSAENCEAGGNLHLSKPKPKKGHVRRSHSFKDLTEVRQTVSDLNAIFPHPPLMTVTVKPARSKSFVNEAKESKPKHSSNSHHDRQCNGNRASTSRLTHHRSSSGPSDISSSDLSLDDDNLKSPNRNGRMKAMKQQEVKNLASTLFNELQKSFDSRSNSKAEGNMNSHEDSDIVLPSEWGALWNPVHKRFEKEKTIKTIKDSVSIWLPADRKPLIKDSSSDASPNDTSNAPEMWSESSTSIHQQSQLN